VTTIERGAGVDGVPSLDDPFERLLADNWLGLVRVWALLLRNSAQAEDVVQDAVIACLRQRAHITDPEQALGYVRRAVVTLLGRPSAGSGSRWPTDRWRCRTEPVRTRPRSHGWSGTPSSWP
jgi:hypothetical protein